MEICPRVGGWPDAEVWRDQEKRLKTGRQRSGWRCANMPLTLIFTLSEVAPKGPKPFARFMKVLLLASCAGTILAVTTIFLFSAHVYRGLKLKDQLATSISVAQFCEGAR